MTQHVPERHAIPVAYTWDAASIFVSEAAWEAELNAVAVQIDQLTAFCGHLAEGPTVVADYLERSSELLQAAGRVSVYATLHYSVNTLDQPAKARKDRAAALRTNLDAAMAFAAPELLTLGAATLMHWAASEPRLNQYAHYFERLLSLAPHMRSAEVEELLQRANEPFDAAAATHGILANADLRFAPASDQTGQPYELTQGTINALLTHTDPALRKSAWEHYADAHLALKNTMAGCLATEVQKNVFSARARRYDSALAAALGPTFIPLEVFHNLIATYQAHLPTWHRYWQLRKRALGGGALHVYDTRAPLTTSPLRVTHAQAIEWVCEGMAPLGAEYVAVMRRGLCEQRWVDVYPNRGKRAGAFSIASPGTHPFILMSHNDDIFGLSTLAHELGHSMHSYYTQATQPYLYSWYGLFLAEVASNFNQALVRAHLLAHLSEREQQISLLEEAMANFQRYFFIMPTLARFELSIHQRVERGEALTADSMIDLMADLFAEGYGDAVTLDRERVGATWMQFSSHLYSNFYVYQYATGIAGAHALTQGILEQREGAVERYLSFLKAGGSRYPLDTLREAGVDLASPQPVEATFGVLANYVQRLENLVG